MRRYPLEPLLAALGKTLSGAQHELGIGGPEYRRYRDEGMSRDVAERKAMKAGLHPYEVWHDMADHDADDLTRECEADGCDRSFMPHPRGGGRRRFCSNACWERDRRARETPEEREARLAARRDYYRRNRERILAEVSVDRLHPSIAERKRRYRRAYYQANRERELERQRRYDRERAERSRDDLAAAG